MCIKTAIKIIYVWRRQVVRLRALARFAFYRAFVAFVFAVLSRAERVALIYFITSDHKFFCDDRASLPTSYLFCATDEIEQEEDVIIKGSDLSKGQLAYERIDDDFKNRKGIFGIVIL